MTSAIVWILLSISYGRNSAGITTVIGHFQQEVNCLESRDSLRKSVKNIGGSNDFTLVCAPLTNPMKTTKEQQ